MKNLRKLIKPIYNCGITIGLINESNYDWKITLTGPKDSPYRNGIFILNAHFPDDYPNKPPEVFYNSYLSCKCKTNCQKIRRRRIIRSCMHFNFKLVET